MSTQFRRPGSNQPRPVEVEAVEAEVGADTESVEIVTEVEADADSV